MSADKFDMLYCDDLIECRVNTFERGDGADAGKCPGCGREGFDVSGKPS